MCGEEVVGRCTGRSLTGEGRFKSVQAEAEFVTFCVESGQKVGGSVGVLNWLCLMLGKGGL